VNDAGTPSRSGSGLQTLDRAVRVLTLLRDAGQPMALKDIAKALEVPPPTAHRLLAALVAHNWVQFDPRTKVYGLGYGLLSYAEGLRTSGLLSLTSPVIQQLSREFGETVTVQIRSGDNRVVIQEIEGTYELRRKIAVGNTLPLYTTASGRAILAFLDDSEVDRILSDGIVPLTPKSTVDMARIREILADVRRTGTAYSVEESALGAGAVAVPIFNAGGTVEASIAMSGPLIRWDAVCTPRLIEQMQAAALATSRRLGFERPMPWERAKEDAP
jgi:DNA-binding IclR family transcriptional regulator